MSIWRYLLLFPTRALPIWLLRLNATVPSAWYQISQPLAVYEGPLSKRPGQLFANAVILAKNSMVKLPSSGDDTSERKVISPVESSHVIASTKSPGSAP